MNGYADFMIVYLSTAAFVVQDLAPATALNAGLAAYQAEDFVAARHHLRPLADRGSAIAETMLGVMAARGEGRVADPAAIR